MAFEEPPHKAIPSGGVTRIHQVHSAIEFEKKCNFLRNLHHLHQGSISKRGQSGLGSEEKKSKTCVNFNL